MPRRRNERGGSIVLCVPDVIMHGPHARDFFLFWKSIIHWSMVITISLQLSADAGVTPILEQLIRLSRC